MPGFWKIKWHGKGLEYIPIELSYITQYTVHFSFFKPSTAHLMLKT